MNRKRLLDTGIALICTAMCAIALLYEGQMERADAVIWTAGISAVFFLLLAYKDKDVRWEAVGRGRMKLSPASDRITELVLLNEEEEELSVWDMYGKTALVIGRDVRENQVDVDLGQSPYASMVDVEHAVLNFSAGSWYAEDLGSANGLGVKKEDGKIYQLSAETPCRLERGDCLYVGQNRLLLR